MFYIFPIAVLSDSMQWQNTAKNVQYDWSSLKTTPEQLLFSSPYRVQIGDEFILDSIYRFGIGSNLATGCTPGDNVAAVEVDEIFADLLESCSVLGRQEMTTVSLLDQYDVNKGILVTYGGGDRCTIEGDSYTGQPRSVNFQLICSQQEGEWTVDATKLDSLCRVYLQKYTRAGCVKAMTSVGSPYKLYWIMACALLVYFALGSLVKFLRGFRGVEAIPNHEFWMDFPGYVQDGIFFSVSKIKQMLGKEDKEYDNV